MEPAPFHFDLNPYLFTGIFEALGKFADILIAVFLLFVLTILYGSRHTKTEQTHKEIGLVSREFLVALLLLLIVSLVFYYVPSLRGIIILLVVVITPSVLILWLIARKSR